MFSISTNRLLLSAAATAVLAFSVAELQAGRATIRETVAEKEAAIVTLEAVFDVRVSFGGQQQEYERRSEEVGIIVDPNGLAITSLSSMDPGQFYARLYGDDDDGFTTQLKDLKYILPDGREIPAGISLRDRDFDIVVLRPLEEPEEDLTYISLNDYAEAELLEELYLLSRKGRIARRAIHASSLEVQSIVDRPRFFYIPPGQQAQQHLGGLVLNADAKPVGMIAMYMFPGGAAALGEEDEPFVAVIVPVEDIMEVVEQARDIAPEAPAPDPDMAIEDEEEDAELDILPAPDMEPVPLP